MLQENFLFSGTIRENITAAKPHATFEEMVRAARLAGAEEFIDRLPRGYETYIYEGSPNLSGGQRQRLAIARALILDPRILILDEATSALDPDSEAIVNDNIRRIAQGRTVIVISHRLSSLVRSDAILVLERGKFEDIGTHDESAGALRDLPRPLAAAEPAYVGTRGPGQAARSDARAEPCFVSRRPPAQGDRRAVSLAVVREYQSEIAARRAQPYPRARGHDDSRAVRRARARHRCSCMFAHRPRGQQRLGRDGHRRSRRIVYQALDPSIIRSLDVKEGQRVGKGQLLATLDPTFVTAPGQPVARPDRRACGRRSPATRR